jgi:recombinational DNA repair protein RecR
LDKEPEKRIKLSALKKRLQDNITVADYTQNGLKEIILSLNTTPEGENTEQIVRDTVRQLIDSTQTKISILGRGLSTGAELEYADSETIKNALGNRR